MTEEESKGPKNSTGIMHPDHYRVMYDAWHGMAGIREHNWTNSLHPERFSLEEGDNNRRRKGGREASYKRRRIDYGTGKGESLKRRA